jgi:hypothetical protein
MACLYQRLIFRPNLGMNVHMGDLDKNIYRKEEPSPYEKIIVNPIEKDRKEREPYTSLKGATRSQIYATLFSFFKKIFSTLSSKEKGQPLILNLQQLIENINAFKQQLVILSLEDQSHNPDYTQHLSDLWHSILEDCNSLSLSPDTSEILTKVKFFISQVQNFPLGADHTLGYYFTEYAGKDWIPFPFMELLQQLHEEYNASPVISVLNNWLSLLNEILALSGFKLK